MLSSLSSIRRSFLVLALLGLHYHSFAATPRPPLPPWPEPSLFSWRFDEPDVGPSKKTAASAVDTSIWIESWSGLGHSGCHQPTTNVLSRLPSQLPNLVEPCPEQYDRFRTRARSNLPSWVSKCWSKSFSSVFTMNILTENGLRAIATELSSPNCNGYLQRPLPCDLDACVEALIDAYVKNSASVKSAISTAIGPEQTFGLLAFAERMAILSVRQKSREPLMKALLALVVEGFRCDAREDILVLALINHSAIEVGADPKQLFDEAAGHASAEVAQYLREFAERRHEDKSIQVMGYSEEMTSDGFNYARNW